MTDSRDAVSAADLAHDIYETRDRAVRPLFRSPRPVRERRRRARRWVSALVIVAVLYAGGGLVYVMVRRREAPATPAPASPPATAAARVGGAADASLLTTIERLREQSRRESADLPEFHRLLDRGLVAKAGALADRALEAAPESIAWRAARARVRLQLEQLREAEEDCLAVLAAQPRNVEARETLAMSLLMQSRPAPAYAAARWVLEDDPGRTSALEIAARAAIEGGLYPDAIVHLRRWLELRPGLAVARDLLGLAYLRSGEYGKAAFVLEDLAREPAATEATFLNLALVYAALRQSGDVTRVFGDAAQRLSPKTVVQWFARPDFAQLRDDSRVMAFMEHLISATTPALSLRMPERPSGPGAGELTLGLAPPSEAIWTRRRVER
ncbi:MAG: hypothetical protein N2652_12320 [Kiritimatiellae bacterium]|nr:hypothetical protein [Kiritimatiellia bacterium]